jgi:hypothetical protein
LKAHYHADASKITSQVRHIETPMVCSVTAKLEAEATIPQQRAAGCGAVQQQASNTVKAGVHACIHTTAFGINFIRKTNGTSTSSTSRLH